MRHSSIHSFIFAVALALFSVALFSPILPAQAAEEEMAQTRVNDFLKKLGTVNSNIDVLLKIDAPKGLSDQQKKNFQAMINFWSESRSRLNQQVTALKAAKTDAAREAAIETTLQTVGKIKIGSAKFGPSGIVFQQVEAVKSSINNIR